ncbi:MAG: GUN4 domain-containing protein [Stigonema ocellatum SAG 48.90 = DSM 106950]|nr:GUN4 domain-containing protein [Stigonema ocellatum SAG 48.90 = DSM 106950]
MLYCFNSNCSNPFNLDGNKFCIKCGETLTPLFRNRYRVIRLLGEGGFGRTYEARDADRMDDPCVIKQFIPQVQGTPALEKATELFKQEAKRLYELGEHPQIPRLVAYFEQDKRLYLVQEFIEGQTLLQQLQQQGAFSEEQIKQLLADLLPVLQFIHEQGVIHRDIKPENIMRRRQDGKLILIDFGVSKQATRTILGEAGTTVGTPGYAPLEQLRGQVFPGSDLYSLGMTCIRLLTKCLPKEDGFDQLYDALSGRWIWRESLPPGTTISPQLGEILDKLIQDYLKNRYQSVNEVLAVLNTQKISATPKSSLLPRQQAITFTVPSNLTSAFTVNYDELEYLLTSGRWREANEETFNVMLKLCGREQQNSLYKEDIEKFFCQDLCTIDKLWVRYSNGRFGFSVQQRIWQSIGGSKNPDYETWCRFGNKVGWIRYNVLWQEFWLDNLNLTFTTDAPTGHLPYVEMIRIVGMTWASILFSRVEACRL